MGPGHGPKSNSQITLFKDFRAVTVRAANGKGNVGNPTIPPFFNLTGKAPTIDRLAMFVQCDKNSLLWQRRKKGGSVLLFAGFARIGTTFGELPNNK